MATNPNNAVGTNGAFGGRTSVNAFNDVLSVFNGRGIIQGWDMAPNEGMIINIGGDGTTRDVAVAEDNIGNKTTINNISEEPIALTIPAAPAASSRIDAVVAYVDNPAQGSATETDNPAACGLIVVEGTVATTPTAPDEEAIRTAITADGGAGTVAYYVVLGTVTVASGTTDISANMLTKGGYAAVTSNNVDFMNFAPFDTEQKIGIWVNGKPLYRKLIFIPQLPNNTTITRNIAGGSRVEPIKVEAYIISNSTTSMSGYARGIPYYNPSNGNSITTLYSEYVVGITSNYNLSSFQGVIEVHYWKKND